MAKNHPVDFVRLVAGLMPKQIDTTAIKESRSVSLEGTFSELETMCGKLGLEIYTKKPLPHDQKEIIGTVIDAPPVKKVAG